MIVSLANLALTPTAVVRIVALLAILLYLPLALSLGVASVLGIAQTSEGSSVLILVPSPLGTLLTPRCRLRICSH